MRWFLLVPLLLLIHIWLNLFFHLDVTPDWLFYDSFPHPEDPPSQGLLPSVLYPWLVFLVIPLSVVGGTIYTAYKKLWWWFGAYMILGGLPIGAVWILTIIG